MKMYKITYTTMQEAHLNLKDDEKLLEKLTKFNFHHKGHLISTTITDIHLERSNNED